MFVFQRSVVFVPDFGICEENPVNDHCEIRLTKLCIIVSGVFSLPKEKCVTEWKIFYLH